MSSTKQISWFTVVESLLSGRREEWDWMQDQMVRPWKDNVYVFTVHCQPLHLVEMEFWKGGAANLEEVNSAYNLKQVAMTLNYQNGPPQHLNSYQLLPLLQHAHSYFSRRLSELHFLILPNVVPINAGGWWPSYTTSTGNQSSGHLLMTHPDPTSAMLASPAWMRCIMS